MSKFSDVYDVNLSEKASIIGKGAFSTVHRCINRETGEVCAVKLINTAKVKSSDIAKIEREIAICKRLKHENIVRLRRWFKDESHYYLVFEFVSGGELFDEIVTRTFYNEKDASECMRQIFSGLLACHKDNIIHRDLKPENLLLASRDKDAPVKITDFGLAVLMTDGPSYFGFAGTPGYLSPEVIKRQAYDTQVDVFACGIILYILLCGYPPFWDEQQQKLYEQIKQGSYDYPSPEWDSVTPAAKDLIDRMLDTNPKTRITIQEAMKHPWIASEEIPATMHRQDTLNALKKFNARRKLKGGIKAVMGVRKMASMVSNPASMFIRESKAGVITPQDTLTSPAADREDKDRMEVLAANQRLFKAIVHRDYSTYKELMDESLTCFEPEAQGCLIEGLEFHRFYFNNLERKEMHEVNTTVIDPRVRLLGDVAVTTYVRLTQFIDVNGNPKSIRSEETRVWQRVRESVHGWKNVHFHRSGGPSAAQ
eukprot:TRINITY_DN9196_c0_g1_i4.p1 TRINITY_DN9196_c0_g1~~TRINITY_DN9196_c0_g1_i4.p1  ORF type:complete len:492 (+),score=123.20 TRINITY_DN9196_c0_g1_i4:35-1477(+)